MKSKFIPVFILLVASIFSCKVDKKDNVEAPKTEQAEKPGTTGAGLKITFNAVVNKDDAFQLFYNEDGTEGFTGDQMIELKVKGQNEPQDMVFLLPDDALPLNLRFDIGTNKELKEVKFNNLKMEYRGKSFNSKGSKFFRYFYPNDQVVCDTINDIAKNVGSKEGAAFDPIIGGTLYLRTELDKLYKQE